MSNNPNPRNDTPRIDAENSDSDGFASSVPLSKPQITGLLVVVVVVAVVAYWMRTDPASGTSELAKVQSEEFEATTETVEDDEGDEDGQKSEEIDVPRNPNDPLAADKAVYGALRNSGRLGGSAS